MESRSKRLFARRSQFAGIAASAALLIALNSAAPAMAALANGNFEAPLVSGLYTTYTVAPASFGWTVSSGSIDHGQHPAATDCVLGPPTQCIDLNGDGPGAIQQPIITVVGQKYRVSFFMSRHRNLILSGTPATMNALINNAPVASFTHAVTGGAAASSGGWQPQHFDFVASAVSTNLGFASTTLQSKAGPQIDNVSVAEVAAAAYDIAVKKQRQGTMYFVNITNPGQTIPAGAKIEVVDVVPQGITLTVAANNAPWTCGPTGTVVGPDSVTCTYAVTAPIPTNGPIPQLHFQSTSPAGHGCPNCVRARLYVPNVIAHVDATFSPSKAHLVPPPWIPINGLALANESNVLNNVSCAQ